MDYQTTMQELESMGTAQNVKIYTKHGVDTALFGVSFGNLGKLKKKIKTDTALAKELWKSKNHDARILATMIADPTELDEKLIDRWAKDLSNYVITDAFNKMVSKTPFAMDKIETWIASDEEFVGQAGWGLLSHIAMTDDSLADKFFDPHLKMVEKNIHNSKNRVRHSMNGALISIALRNEKLEAKASKVAEKIGKVEVDHGETSCTTPDALKYIEKTKKHHAKKAAAKAAKAKAA